MIDILFAVFMAIALIKGYRKGLVVALFSVIGFIIGLAAALKLSAVVAVHLQKNTSVPGTWLPVLSFFLVFIVVAILVNWGGKIIQKTFEMALLGWANRLAGMLLYAVLYGILFSFLLFYGEKIHLFSSSAIAQSVTFPWLRPWAPTVLDSLGKLIPLFKDSFAQLESFFEGLSHKIPQ